MATHSSLRKHHNSSWVNACLCVMLSTGLCLAQSPSTTSLANRYQQARAAYASKDFQRSAELFQAVAAQCPGSELAIQCEYFAAISDWARDPCDASAAKINNWLEHAEKFQRDAIQSGRTFDDKLLKQWTESSTLIHAKWDRQKQRVKDAEDRLRSFLKPKTTDNAAFKDSPEAWIELGNILLQQRQELAEAKECFVSAAKCSHASETTTCQAAWGAALACWYSQQYAEADEFLNKLKGHSISEDLNVKSKLLKLKVTAALGDAVDFAKELDPIVQLALASNPEAATLYELALALIDAGLQANSQEILFELVHRFPQTPVSIEARVRLARGSCNERKWTEAIEWANQALGMSCPKELLPHVHLIRGQAQLESGALDEATADLQLALDASGIDVEFQISVHYYLAETYYQAEKWAQATEHWQWLLQTAESTPSKTNHRDWLPTVLLRTAELLALKKEWGQAEQIVLRIRNDFPKCNRSCEVDYLLARCLISKAEFEAARQVLGALTQSVDNVPSELLARANWMAGETYLMQRKYDEARQAYERVLLIPDQKYWHSASLLQIGQCCESMQDSQGARNAYEQLETQFEDSPFTAIAKERRKLLPSLSAKQIEQDSLGTKR